MYGYTPQQAAYAQYTHNQQATTYSSNPVNYTTQQPQQHGAANGAATAPAQLQSVGTPATQYSNSQQYSYPNAASAYAQYSQSATTAQQSYGIADFSSDHNTGTNPYTYPNFADYANAFKSVSGNTTNYGSKPITGSGLSGGKPGPAGGIGPGHYAGFESAVTAAATSYMHAKSAGKAGAWLNTGGKKFGGFSKKRLGLGHQRTGGADVTQFFCEICKISCAGAQTFKEHQEGKSHKKKEAAANNTDGQKATIAGNRPNYHCSVCDVTCSSKDTYDAHVKGAKHTKTLSLLTKLNKPIPSLDPVIIQPEPKREVNPTLRACPVKNGEEFIGSAKLVTSAMYGMEIRGETVDGQQKEITGAIEPEVKPIGEEFVEEEHHPNSGKFLSYHCKLCDCKFSDVNAKDIHLKGRRHRLQYKAKVNPELKVSVKQSGSGKRTAPTPRIRSLPQYLLRSQPSYPTTPSQQLRPLFPVTRSTETIDDLYVINKLVQIQFSQEEMKAIEKLVSFAEKTLKTVSDAMIVGSSNKEAVEEGSDVPSIESTQNVKSDDQAAQADSRILKGVMRVGLLAKNILLKSDKQVDLVMLCSKVPSESLLYNIVDIFKKMAQIGPNDGTLTVEPKTSESALVLSLSSIPMLCRVTLTCVGLRESIDAKDGGTAAPASIEKPQDALPISPCLNALAELRHSKYYQVRCVPLNSMNATVKIARDIGNRVTTWGRLPLWTLELLAEKAISSLAMPLSPGDAVRRLFEVVSSGILITNHATILDPCEKVAVNVLHDLTDQEREDITSSSQHALRLIAFNQIYKILAVSRLPDKPVTNINGAGTSMGMKRSAAAADMSDQKKEKKEELPNIP